MKDSFTDDRCKNHTTSQEYDDLAFFEGNCAEKNTIISMKRSKMLYLKLMKLELSISICVFGTCACFVSQISSLGVVGFLYFCMIFWTAQGLLYIIPKVVFRSNILFFFLHWIELSLISLFSDQGFVIVVVPMILTLRFPIFLQVADSKNNKSTRCFFVQKGKKYRYFAAFFNTMNVVLYIMKTWLVSPLSSLHSGMEETTSHPILRKMLFTWLPFHLLFDLLIYEKIKSDYQKFLLGQQTNIQKKEVEMKSLCHRFPEKMLNYFSGIIPSVQTMKGLEELQETEISLLNDAHFFSKACVKQVESISDFDEIQEGKLEVKKEAFDLTSLMQRVLETKRQQLKLSNKQSLVLDDSNVKYERFPKVIVGDVGRIYEIMNNIVSNAIKYSDKGTIRVYCTYDRLMKLLNFRCNDEGIGIAKENLQKIGKPFEKISDTTGRQSFGLGLYITKRIVEESLSGKIKFHSDGPGLGTKMGVVLPLYSGYPCDPPMDSSPKTMPKTPTCPAIIKEPKSLPYIPASFKNFSFGTPSEDVVVEGEEGEDQDDNFVPLEESNKLRIMIVDSNEVLCSSLRLLCQNGPSRNETRVFPSGSEAMRDILVNGFKPNLFFVEDVTECGGHGFFRRVMNLPKFEKRKNDLFFYLLTTTKQQLKPNDDDKEEETRGWKNKEEDELQVRDVLKKPICNDTVMKILDEVLKNLISTENHDFASTKIFNNYSKHSLSPYYSPGGKSRKRLKMKALGKRRSSVTRRSSTIHKFMKMEFMIGDEDTSSEDEPEENKKVEICFIESLKTFNKRFMNRLAVPLLFTICLWLFDPFLAKLSLKNGRRFDYQITAFFSLVDFFISCFFEKVCEMDEVNTGKYTFLVIASLVSCLENTFIPNFVCVLIFCAIHAKSEKDLMKSAKLILFVYFMFEIPMGWFGFFRPELVFGSFVSNIFLFVNCLYWMCVLLNKKEEMEEEMEKVNDELSALFHRRRIFLSRVSHELRSPISAFFFYFHTKFVDAVNERHVVMNKLLQEGVNLIRRASCEINKDIENLFLVCQFQNGRMKLVNTKFSIKKELKILLEEQVNAMMWQKKKSVKVKIAYASTLQDVTVTMDWSSIRIIIRNIVSNALEYSEKGVISIDSRIEEEEDKKIFYFCVEDEGVGMSHEEVDQIFRMGSSSSSFMEEPTKRTKSFFHPRKSLSIGMFCCFTLTKLLGGRLSVDSEFGKGTLVTFRCECSNYEKANPETNLCSFKRQEEEELSEEKKIRIFFLDDCIMFTKMFRIFLVKLGYSEDQIFTTTTEEDGLSIYEQHGPFDLSFCDYNLRNWKAERFFGEVDQRRRNEGLQSNEKRIILSGGGCRLSSEEKKDLNIVCVMSKPFSSGDLERVVNFHVV